MNIYINIIDKKYKINNKWNKINSYFRNIEKWEPGKKKYIDVDIDKQEAFTLFIALIYKEKLLQIVKQRKWEKFWIPLSYNYLKYKKRKGYPENIWIRTRLLINSISIWYDTNKEKIIIGIPENIYYEDNNIKIPVLVVAKWMEYGNAKIPPRPLFRRVQMDISKQISGYYNEFDKLYEEY
ncbi:MAG: hypothetical protein ACM31H_01015 [Nitrososphaerales archaeon]